MLNRIHLIIFLVLSHTSVAMTRSEACEQLLYNQEFELVIEWLEPFMDRDDCLPSDYTHLIYAYLAIADYSNSITYCNKLIDISLKKKDTIYLLKASRYKTAALWSARDLEGSIASVEFSLKYYNPTDTIGINRSQLRLGLFHHEQGNNELAYEVYRKIKYENVVLSESEGEYFNNFGLIYSAKGFLDSSLYYYKKSILYKQNTGANSLSLAYSNIAANYITLEKYEMAIAYLDSSTQFDLAKNSPVFELIFENYYIAYNKIGIADSALVYLHKLKEFNDSLFLQKMDLEISELKDQYKREVTLKTKIIRKDQILEKSKLQLGLSIIILLLIFILASGIILLLRYKNLKVSRNNLLTKQRLLRSQITPHFLYNSLSTIQGMILNEENKLASNYLSKFSKLVRLILKNSRDKIVLLSDELEAINYYLDLQNARFSDMLEYSIRLGENVQDESLYVPPMLIQPFVENCIEHGFNNIDRKGEIDIHIYFDKKSLICKITDNGVGVDTLPPETIIPKKESISTGITMERMSLLAKEFKTSASLEIVDRKKYNQQGTIVTLEMPHKHD